jgi:glycerol uptake facilitator-like aquaporin
VAKTSIIIYVMESSCHASSSLSTSTSFANPAVTIARTLSDTFAGIAPSSVPMFVLMQVVGAGLAVPLVRLLFPTTEEAV